MRFLFLAPALVVIAASTGATAQSWAPGQTSIGDPLAGQQRYRTEIQRQQSADQAAFARQHQLNARLTQLEIEAQRRPEPYIPLVETDARSSEVQRQARERATAQRRSTVAGVTQIDDWLARSPR
ncbi:MAG: hypothetical protein V4701_03785 [Pseudomonadota bacterium]